jgi:hypothetical protein
VCHMPCHLIFFDLITLIAFGEDYKLWNASVGSNIFLSTLFSMPSIYVLPLTWQAKFHTHTRGLAHEIKCSS